MFKFIVILQVLAILFMGYEIYDSNSSFEKFVPKSQLVDTKENIEKFKKFVYVKKDLENTFEVQKTFNYDFLENNMLNIHDKKVKQFIHNSNQLLLASTNELFLFNITKKGVAV